MEVEEYARIAAAEDDHWWYRNTRALMARPARSLARHRVSASSTPGAGPGGNGAWLAAHGEVVGVDLAPEALAFVRARRPATDPGARERSSALPFADASFDVVVGSPCSTRVARRRRGGPASSPGSCARAARSCSSSLRSSRLAPRPRRDGARPAPLPARGARRAAQNARASACERSTYAYSFLAPPAAVLGVLDRPRPRRPADEHRLRRRARRARPGVRAAGRAPSGGGSPATTCRSERPRRSWSLA